MLNMERYSQNLTILASFKNNGADPELLKQYSGWDGLRKAIYTPEVYRELKKSLTPEEITSLKQTLSSAYYTPVELVNFIYGFLEVQGFSGGDILEPAIGHGVFIEYMPPSLRQNSRITAVEIDAVSSQIVQKLYPDITLYHQGFETWHTEQRFDAIIGNPPYGSQTLFDEQHPDLKEFCIHHYFIAKCMRLLKPDGILAMVLPSYFMDNTRDHVRNIIHQEGGSLVAAYRLPEDLFRDAKVTIDIIFLKKGETGKNWLRTRDVHIGGNSKPMNEYYHAHSHHILGNLEIVPMYNRTGLTCKRRGDPWQLLNHTLNTLKQARLAKLAQEMIDLRHQEQQCRSAGAEVMHRLYSLSVKRVS